MNIRITPCAIVVFIYLIIIIIISTFMQKNLTLEFITSFKTVKKHSFAG